MIDSTRPRRRDGCGRVPGEEDIMTTIGTACSRAAVFATREVTVATAKLMRENHVGSIVVVEQVNSGRERHG